MNTASAYFAAKSFPLSEDPACTSSGLPCSERGTLSGPRTRKRGPAWSMVCTLDGSAKVPDAASRTSASSSQLSHSAVATSTNSAARS